MAQPPKGLALYLLSPNRGLFYEMHGVLWDVLPQTGVSSLMLNFVKWELDAVSSRGWTLWKFAQRREKELEKEQSEKDWAEKRQHAKWTEPKTYYHTLESQ